MHEARYLATRREIWIGVWLCMFEDIVKILTFMAVKPGWYWKYLYWRVHKNR